MSANTRPDGTTAVITVLDTETTGLDPDDDEVIALALVTLDVDRISGRVVRTVGEQTQWREPQAAMSPIIEDLTGIRCADLRGRQFDMDQVMAALDRTDLVVAFHAQFDRPFLEALIPRFRTLRWSCARREIDWSGELGLADTGLTAVCNSRGLDAGDVSVLGCARNLAALLAMPLPGREETGFARLLEQSAKRSLACMFFEAEEPASVGSGSGYDDMRAAVSVMLAELGFEVNGDVWRRDGLDEVSLQQLQSQLDQHLGAGGHLAGSDLFHCPLDAYQRYSQREQFIFEIQHDR